MANCMVVTGIPCSSPTRHIQFFDPRIRALLCRMGQKAVPRRDIEGTILEEVVHQIFPSLSVVFKNALIMETFDQHGCLSVLE